MPGSITTALAGAPPLPVDAVLPRITDALARNRSVVLEAPPGAGKTTRVPLALLAAEDAPAGRVVLLEPRRLAARASARRMAGVLGEAVGASVGLTTRDERRVSPATRLEVVTEGVLLRRLQRDPSLDGVAAVLFDEFHERSIAADLGLAFAIEVRRALRGELRLVVMSATLDGARVAALLGDAEIVRADARRFEVATTYRPRPVADRLEPHVVAAVVDALADGPGDVLVFVDGAATIRRVVDDLTTRVPADVVLAPLYGALRAREQDRALSPAPAGRRKVVVATDIAETSLTVPGVRAVVDAGLVKAPRFDPRTGLSRLATVRISRDSADQRRGRAGRVAPGRCYRLWGEREHAGLAAHRTPEVAQAELAGFAGEVAAWGARDPGDLPLLDAPPRRAYDEAVALLRDLEALDGDGRITAHGRELVALPLHPRLAHLVLRGAQQGLGPLACDLAALLADRDVLAGRSPPADLGLRVRILRGDADRPSSVEVRSRAVDRARREADRLRRRLRVRGRDDPERAGELLALAYPDRIAQRRGGRGRFLLASGRGATLAEGDLLAAEDHLAVADVDLGASEARIFQAAAVDVAALERSLAPRLHTIEVVAWERQVGEVTAERQRRLGALVLGRRPLQPPPDDATTAALLTGVREAGLSLLPWTRAACDLVARARFLHRELGAPWPDVSDDTLVATLEAWLAPFLAGLHQRADLARVPLLDALRARIGWERVADLRALAPTHATLPTGTRTRLDYTGDAPILAARVQQLFGLTETPRVAGGRVPVVVHLLSPAGRAVQVTTDLAGFWQRGYADVRAELRGRYPKHAWPADPLTAQPTDRARPRGG